MAMQREEFTERTQTWKSDMNQGEQTRQENRRRFPGELAEGARQLLALEQALGGQAGGFGEWLRAAYEINEDFEEPYSKVVDDICQAFRDVERRYGAVTAQRLYDAHAVILPTEIKSAAGYLSFGGRLEDLPALAESGFLLEELGRDAVTRAVAHMEAGGAAADAYLAATGGMQPKPQDARQQFRQTMGR